MPRVSLYMKMDWAVPEAVVTLTLPGWAPSGTTTSKDVAVMLESSVASAPGNWTVIGSMK